MSDARRSGQRGWASGEPEAKWVALVGSLALIGLSASALLLAPLFVDNGYSIVSQSLSEAGSQGLAGGWAARLGFFAFGLAVLWLATAMHGQWSRFVWWPHALFGVYMMATAVFSHAPWQPGIVGDAFEDALHSAASTIVGIAFALGTAARFAQRRIRREGGGAFDLLAAAAAVMLPLAMLAAPQWDGVVQRVMFGIAYAWYLREAFTLREAMRRGWRRSAP